MLRHVYRYIVIHETPYYVFLKNNFQRFVCERANKIILSTSSKKINYTRASFCCFIFVSENLPKLKTSHTIAKKKTTWIISQPPSKKAKRNKRLYILPIANLPHPLLPFQFPVNVRTNIVINNTNDNQNSSNKSVGSTYNALLATAVVLAINVCFIFLFYICLGEFFFLLHLPG